MYCCLIARWWLSEFVFVLTGFMVVSEVGAVFVGRLIMVSDDDERLSVPATPSRKVAPFPRGSYTREIVHRTRPGQDALSPHGELG